MKTKNFLLLVLISITASSEPTQGATKKDDGTLAADKARREVDYSTRSKEPEGKSLLSGHIRGMEVRNTQGDRLGKIDDLMLDLESGHVDYAVISSGGFLGIGDKVIAVPARKFALSADGKFLVVDADKAKFEGGPKFDRTTWPDASDPSWMELVDRYHAEVKRGTDDSDKVSKKTSLKAANSLGLMKASEIKGKTVKSATGHELGKIWDVDVDMPRGRISDVIIDTGSGDAALKRIGAKSTAPGSSPGLWFHAGADKKAVYLEWDKAQLASSPSFDPAKGIGFETADVDNTRRNVRDRDKQNLTPLDQGTSDVDRGITQAIRKWIVIEPGKDRFSSQAHNIKIIARNGTVTLRGVVKNADEKRQIEAYAKTVEGVRSVDNQLEVKAE